MKFKRNTILYKNRKKKVNEDVKIRFITDYEPAFPSIRGAIRGIEEKIENSDLLKRMFPKGGRNIQVSMRRGAKNIKELLATTKIDQREERAMRTGSSGPCDKPCVHCPVFKPLEGPTFTSTVTKRTYKIRQMTNCQSKMGVYLITCRKCQIQGVGSTDVIYSRLGNYKTNIKKGKGSCGIERHFNDGNHTFEDFHIQIIVQLEKIPKNRTEAFKRLREFEGYWQIELCTLQPQGMNTIDEFHRNKYAQAKPSFHKWELN